MAKDKEINENNAISTSESVHYRITICANIIIRILPSAFPCLYYVLQYNHGSLTAAIP